MINTDIATLWVERALLLIAAACFAFASRSYTTETIRKTWLRLRSALDSKNPDAGTIGVIGWFDKVPLDLIAGRIFPVEPQLPLIPEGTEADLNLYYDFLTRSIQGTACMFAPAGWYCTRDAEHDGPCSARPIPGNTQHHAYDDLPVTHDSGLPTNKGRQIQFFMYDDLVPNPAFDPYASLAREMGARSVAMTAMDRLNELRREEASERARLDWLRREGLIRDHHRAERRMKSPVHGAPYQFGQPCPPLYPGADTVSPDGLFDYALRSIDWAQLANLFSVEVVGKIQDEFIIEWSLRHPDHVPTSHVWETWFRTLEERVRKLEQKTCAHPKGFETGLCSDCGLRRDVL